MSFTRPRKHHGQRKEMLFGGLCGDLYSSKHLHLTERTETTLR